MLKNIYLIISFFLISLGLKAASFYPNKGIYKYKFEDVEKLVTSKQNAYLFLESDMVYPKAEYKFNSLKNEFQIKDWYLQDWYSLQNLFKLDFDVYLKTFRAKSFNEAKISQYSEFKFNFKKFYHYKNSPSLKEWGGLTHPPLKRLTRPLNEYHPRFGMIDYSKITSSYFNPELQKELDLISNSELSFNNKLKVLADGDSFRAKKELILHATESIFISSLVFVCDPSTKELVSSLIKKHQEGIKVRVIADGFISKWLGHRQCLKEMRSAGIEVIETKDFFAYQGRAIYHTKTLVVDNRYAIAGGQNLIDADNTSRGVDFKNRDIDLFVEGPLVLDIAKQFLENWHFQRKKFAKIEKNTTPLDQDLAQIRSQIKSQRLLGMRGSDHYNNQLQSPLTRMNGVCRFIKQAPHEDRKSIGKAYLKLLDQVEDYLVMTNPIMADTFSPRKRFGLFLEGKQSYLMFNQLHQKLLSLSKKGIKLDHITTNIDMAGNENVAILNEKIRKQLLKNATIKAHWSYLQLIFSNRFFGKSHYKNLLNDWVTVPNINVWTHISFMHSKIFYFDRIVASIGSFNLQHNATDQAYESTSICMDENLNRQLDEVLVMDMANSIPLVFSR